MRNFLFLNNFTHCISLVSITLLSNDKVSKILKIIQVNGQYFCDSDSVTVDSGTSNKGRALDIETVEGIRERSAFMNFALKIKKIKSRAMIDSLNEHISYIISSRYRDISHYFCSNGREKP